MSGARWIPAMVILTAFQFLTFAQIVSLSEALSTFGQSIGAGTIFILFLVMEWAYAIGSTIFLKKHSMALECIAFFLTGIGLAVCACQSTSYLLTQFLAVVLGFAVYIGLLWILSDVDRADKYIIPMEILAIALLIFGLAFASFKNGAYNWVKIGSISFQPSEIVKIPFIFVGAASLEKLQTSKNIWHYVGFAVTCIGLLFLMRDLGTALIFFVAFVVLAFMRSGDLRTLLFIIVAAGLAAAMVVMLKSDYVLRRFATYRHIWDDIYGTGFQQTHALTYAVSGGLVGMGVGNGYLRNLAAATEDLIFGIVCEEFGMAIGFLVLICYLLIFIHAIRNANGSTSAFYSIATCAAGTLLLFQAGLDAFGMSDFLPFTGVTLPFVSHGGTSMISCWGLLAFIKSADNRTWAKGGKKKA